MNSPSKREKRVFERYQQLAGLVRDGKMANSEKENRARLWVVEQEKSEVLNANNWYKTVFGQITIGLFVTVVGGLILAVIVKLIIEPAPRETTEEIQIK